MSTEPDRNSFNPSDFRREEKPDGIYYHYKDKLQGPFTEQDEVEEKLEDHLAKAFGLDRKTLYAYLIHQPRRKITLSADMKPHDVAEMILESHAIVTLKDTGEILVYVNGVYIKGGDTFLAAEIEQEAHKLRLDKIVTANFVRETLEHVKRRTYRDRKEFHANPEIINVRNGLIDLRTFTFTEHTSKHLSLVQLPVKYDPSADCPRIKKFHSEVNYAEDGKTVQEIVGYTLWTGYPAQIAVMLIGTGSNGKSTFINLIKALLGLENIAARSLQDLLTNRFAAADLHGKLVNLYADLADQALRFTGQFKMLTGGDPITAEYKFRNGFAFINFAKLIFSANKIPEVYEDSYAFFRRWIIITFPNLFEGGRENRNLLKELTTPEELSGFLNWALEGLQRLRDNQWQFSNSKSVSEVREDYIRKSSPTQAFLLDCVDENPDGRIPKPQLFLEFCEYCRNHKLPVPSQDVFYKHLPRFIHIEESREAIEGKGKRVRCFKGYSLRPREDWGKSNADDDNDETLDLTKQEDREAALHRLKQLGSHYFKSAEEMAEYLSAFCDRKAADQFIHEIMDQGKIMSNVTGFWEVV